MNIFCYLSFLWLDVGGCDSDKGQEYIIKSIGIENFRWFFEKYGFLGNIHVLRNQKLRGWEGSVVCIEFSVLFNERGGTSIFWKIMLRNLWMQPSLIIQNHISNFNDKNQMKFLKYQMMNLSETSAPSRLLSIMTD